MKDSMDSTVVGRSLDSEVFANRKLIRPAFNRNERPRPENGDRRDGNDAPNVLRTERKSRLPSRPTPRIFTIRNKCRPRHPWSW